MNPDAEGHDAEARDGPPDLARPRVTDFSSDLLAIVFRCHAERRKTPAIDERRCGERLIRMEGGAGRHAATAAGRGIGNDLRLRTVVERLRTEAPCQSAHAQRDRGGGNGGPREVW